MSCSPWAQDPDLVSVREMYVTLSHKIQIRLTSLICRANVPLNLAEGLAVGHTTGSGIQAQEDISVHHFLTDRCPVAGDMAAEATLGRCAHSRRKLFQSHALDMAGLVVWGWDVVAMGAHKSRGRTSWLQQPQNTCFPYLILLSPQMDWDVPEEDASSHDLDIFFQTFWEWHVSCVLTLEVFAPYSRFSKRLEVSSSCGKG